MGGQDACMPGALLASLILFLFLFVFFLFVVACPVHDPH
jgi:hypothetical protein